VVQEDEGGMRKIFVNPLGQWQSEKKSLG